VYVAERSNETTRHSLATTSISVGSKELLASGIVLFGAAEQLSLKLADGAEQLSLDFVVQRRDSTSGIKPPQLTFTTTNETTAQFLFRDTPPGLLPIAYEVAIGTIANKKLTGQFLVSALGTINELRYSFWGEPQANG
jgi:hypothetical protein